ncbi:MAG: hypothetical protein J2P40_00555 [Candidatus Dormibacteraeota bacterium]|nr:hypothetical protein [Candidatus Dormibacteraeota bacterium]MBO0759739.1 hypothetical protein [Candidatus Dormibacteraeota bacterium]
MAPSEMSKTDPQPSLDLGSAEAEANATVDPAWLDRARAAAARMLALAGRDPRGALPTGRTRAGD